MKIIKGQSEKSIWLSGYANNEKFIVIMNSNTYSASHSFKNCTLMVHDYHSNKDFLNNLIENDFKYGFGEEHYHTIIFYLNIKEEEIADFLEFEKLFNYDNEFKIIVSVQTDDKRIIIEDIDCWEQK